MRARSQGDRHAGVPTNRNRAPSTLAFEERLARLRSLIERFEPTSNSTHPTARDQHKRLVKIREEITRLVKNEARSFCNCNQFTTIAGQTPEEFEAEMELACPVHGLRRLGVIVHLGSVPPDDDDLRIRELMKKYYRKLTGNPEVI